jgi:hypothetical protein
MRVIEQSTTPTILFLVVLATDHVTGLTGVTPTVYLSKSGSTATTTTNSATAVDATNMPGVYKITLTATETNTLGDLWLRFTATGADQSDRLFVVETATVSNIDAEVDAMVTAVAAIPTAPPATVVLAAFQPNYAPAKASDVTITVKPTLTMAEHDQLMAIPLTNSGSGSIISKIIVTDPAGHVLDGVACWISSDYGGTDVISGTLITNAYGVANFTLDAGTCYLWRQRGGFNFDNPTPLTIPG